MNRDDRLFAIIGGLVVATVTIGFLIFAGGITGTVDTRPPVEVAAPSAVAGPSPAPEVVAASLEPAPAEAADELIRAVLAGLAAHPQWTGWLVTDDLLGRFAAAVEAVADGYSPREALDFLAPWRPFLVRESDERLVIAAGTYRRYDLVAAVVDSIDADAAVALYRELEPEIVRARADVAWHRGDFSDRLQAAVDHLLAVEIPSGPIEVEQRTRSYVFADYRLEGLSDAQRQLLRMGAGNAARVQHKLREIRSAFGWPEAEAEASVRHALVTGEAPTSEPPPPARIAEAEAAAPEAPALAVPVPAEPLVAESAVMTPIAPEPRPLTFEASLITITPVGPAP
ncbi:MAG TPA: DUF3014 domain-containing protein [Methylomirabilota bacterium]|nr:DUF3014 domain-containing protein [Methylomirabilota bacterium]